MVQAHVIAKHTSIRYDCDECDFQTAYKQMVRKHKEAKHSNGVHPYNCDSCIFTAATTTTKLDTHRKNVHGAQFVCHLCDFTSITELYLKRHRKSVHSESRHVKAKHTSMIYACDECDFQTANKQMVRKHRESKHSNGVHPYNCDSCIFTAATTTKLDTHIKNVHGAQFGCHLCEFKSVTEVYLNDTGNLSIA